VASTKFLRFDIQSACVDYVAAINSAARAGACPWWGHAGSDWCSVAIYPGQDSDGKWVAPYCYATQTPAEYSGLALPSGYVLPGNGATVEVVDTISWPDE
jgi:hypothetical protein